MSQGFVLTSVFSAGPMGGKKVKEDMTALCFRVDCMKHNSYILTWSLSYTEAG